jgi:hypothetical protein
MSIRVMHLSNGVSVHPFYLFRIWKVAIVNSCVIYQTIFFVKLCGQGQVEAGQPVTDHYEVSSSSLYRHRIVSN